MRPTWTVEAEGDTDTEVNLQRPAVIVCCRMRDSRKMLHARIQRSFFFISHRISPCYQWAVISYANTMSHDHCFTFQEALNQPGLWGEISFSAGRRLVHRKRRFATLLKPRTAEQGLWSQCCEIIFRRKKEKRKKKQLPGHSCMHSSLLSSVAVGETVAVWAEGGSAGFTKKQPCHRRWEHMIHPPDIDTTGGGRVMQCGFTVPASVLNIYSQ